MIVSCTVGDRTINALYVRNGSESCYTRDSVAELEELRIELGIGEGRTEPLSREGLHFLCLGPGSDMTRDDIAWVDDRDATKKDDDAIVRDGASVTVTKVARKAIQEAER